MKLTAENIQFIDNYLRHSEVFYVDIRMEMIDHIAAAVEDKMEAGKRDFYDTFKIFMLAHKKEILKGNRKASSFDFSVLRRFGKFLLKPQMLVFLSLFLVVGSWTYKVMDVVFWNDELVSYILIFLMVAQLIYTRLWVKMRFFHLERAYTIPMLLFYFKLCFMGRTEGPFTVFKIYFLLYCFAAYVLFFCWHVYVFRKSTQILYT